MRACPEVLAQLEALFSCPAERAFLEKKDINPKELAYRIRDFISEYREASPESNIDSKDGPYQNYTPKYNTRLTLYTNCYKTIISK